MTLSRGERTFIVALEDLEVISHPNHKVQRLSVFFDKYLLQMFMYIP